MTVSDGVSPSPNSPRNDVIISDVLVCHLSYWRYERCG